MERAYRSEDVAGAMALVAPGIPGYEQFGTRLSRLFADSNFFDAYTVCNFVIYRA